MNSNFNYFIQYVGTSLRYVTPAVVKKPNNGLSWKCRKIIKHDSKSLSSMVNSTKGINKIPTKFYISNGQHHTISQKSMIFVTSSAPDTNLQQVSAIIILDNSLM